jgi:2-polyprenyl-3-methyl-5-hydroxy-6-metoxy-1,4-benzoquinol methylase
MIFTKTNCAVCQLPTDSSPVYSSSIDDVSFSTEVFSARRVPDRRHYAWVRCKICGLLRSDPIATTNLAELYQKSTFDYSTEINGLKLTYFRIIKRFEKYLPDRRVLLEVGGGNGFFLEEVVDNSFAEVVGIEPSISAVNAARPDIKLFMKIGMMEPGIFPNNTFNLVCMFHVLDHLEDPLTVIQNCVAALKPNGYFIVAVHNEKSWSARLMGEKSPIVDVEHTYLYSRQSAKKLFARAGLIEITSGSYWNKYSLSYLIHLIPIPVKMKSGIINSRFGKILSLVSVTVPLGNMWVAGKKNDVNK